MKFKFNFDFKNNWKFYLILLCVLLIMFFLVSFLILGSYAHLAYLLFLLVYAGYSAYALNHLYEYCYKGDSSQTVIMVYTGVSLSIIALTFILLSIFGGK